MGMSENDVICIIFDFPGFIGYETARITDSGRKQYFFVFHIKIFLKTEPKNLQHSSLTMALKLVIFSLEKDLTPSNFREA